jgi:2-polyprenyl-3-methyl-5-hydroxy-6-metoxy-1,4-benzoquinol methylase
MLAKIMNELLGLVGYRITRITSDADIDPINRNARDTLDILWGNTQFNEKYYNMQKRLLYRDVIAVAKERGLFADVQTIADVGCGGGYFMRALSEVISGKDLFGYDFSESALNVARQVCPSGQYTEHDIYNDLGRQVDIVFCMETLEHLMHPDRALARLVQASRTVVLTVPDGRKNTWRGHINFWSKESWKVFLEECVPAAAIYSDYVNRERNLIAVITGI